MPRMRMRLKEKLESLKRKWVKQAPVPAVTGTPPLSNEEKVRETVFRFATIVLAAKLASADSPVNGAEIEAFQKIFPECGGLYVSTARLFAQACADINEHFHYARRIAQYFPDETMRKEKLIHQLLRLAEADNPLNAEEMAYLQQAANMLGLPRGYIVARIKKQYTAQIRNPYSMLGVPRSVGERELKRRYRSAVQTCHPDRLQNKEFSPEVRELMRLRFENITAAYQTIRREI